MNMGCSIETAAAPFAAAIFARRTHFRVLIAPIPKYTGTRPAHCDTAIFSPRSISSSSA